MIYRTADDWWRAEKKRVLLFGMSGLGKTYLSNLLRADGSWYHYSVDYRIGTRYMGEHIVDNFKKEAMKSRLLRELLMSDSIYIGSNITFNNLSPLSTYLGKPGDPNKGGLPFEEYMSRQEQHRQAEIGAMLDTAHFINRAEDIYGYANFVCDSSGSICEVVDPASRDDPVLTALAQSVLLIWIEGTEAHTENLIRRFDRKPKPMYYRPEFMRAAWDGFLAETGATEATADPDQFLRATYAKALAHRRPRYEALARNWGIRVSAEEVAGVTSADEFEALVGRTLERLSDAA